MKGTNHVEIQNLLLTGRERLEESKRAKVSVHLASCEECHTFADGLRWLEPALQNSLQDRWDSSLPSRGFAEKVMQQHRRKQMNSKLLTASRTLAWVGGLALVVVLLAWAIPVLVFNQTPGWIDFPQVLSLFQEHPPTAVDINLQPEDLGHDWDLAFDIEEYDPMMYMDVDDTGQIIIRYHTMPVAPLFTAEDLESYNARGFVHRDRETVIYTLFGIFKDEAKAQQVFDVRFPLPGDSDIPEEFKENLLVEVGNKGIQVQLLNTFEGDKVFVADSGFHTKRSGFFMGVFNHKQGQIPFTTEQVLDLVRKVEARVPAGY